MKIGVEFDEKTAEFIRAGYYKKYKVQFNESIHFLKHQYISEYINLGKKVKRQEAFSNFIKNWAVVIFWILAIASYIGYSVYKTNQENIVETKPSSSGIYYSEVCAITTCNDGSCSTSTGRGTCSHHGGVRN